MIDKVKEFFPKVFPYFIGAVAGAIIAGIFIYLAG